MPNTITRLGDMVRLDSSQRMAKGGPARAGRQLIALEHRQARSQDYHDSILSQA
jgi:hypothetical protein